MNLSYEKLLAEYKKEKTQAEKLARELQKTNGRLNEANDKLKETSVRDYLRVFIIDVSSLIFLIKR